MIKRNQRENVNLPPKQKGNYTTTATTSRPWSGLRNPRIVRVSRAFGGKDRHSKVSTVKGLRDRRVRLSVPTAIQLYDLQDKLGLNQPSKVVDWLINKAQNEIDKLPPLQFPVYENSNFASHEDIGATNYKPNGKGLLPTFPQSTHPKHGEVDLNESVLAINKGNEPYTSYYQWEQAPNAYLSQLGIIRAPIHQPDTLNIIPSSMSLLPDHSQMVSLCSPKIVPPLMFGPTFGEFDGSSASQNPHYFSEN